MQTERRAEGDVEIIPVFDGEDQKQDDLIYDPRIFPVVKKHEGMRAAINAGVEASHGTWIMKTDAHCAFAPGWDTQLVKDSKKDWLMIPRRYSLDGEKWERNEKRPVVDRHFLSFPGDRDSSSLEYGYSLQVMNTWHKAPEGVSDTMIFQGSCWFANREYFMEHIFPLDDVNYGPFTFEQEEIGLKYWLGGGAIKVNTNTWYAHLSKRKKHYDSKEFSRKNKRPQDMIKYNEWGTDHWMNNKEPNMVHPFSWLIEKFWPLSGWPENWQEEYDNRTV